jgi:hypothetical protein
MQQCDSYQSLETNIPICAKNRVWGFEKVYTMRSAAGLEVF